MFIFKISLDHGLIGYSFLVLLYSEARCGYNTKIPQITIISYTIIRSFRVTIYQGFRKKVLKLRRTDPPAHAGAPLS